jgi:hypothetical protein
MMARGVGGRVRIEVYAALAIAEAKLGTKAGLEAIAQAIVDDARGSAPVDTGEFRDSMAVTSAGDKVYAEAGDERSLYIEYGTSDTPAHGTMTNAARKFGKYTGMQPR